jgi:hypothetical protein
MKKLYSEEKYNTYCEFLDKQANEDDIATNYQIYLQMKQWIKDNKIPEIVIDQMDQRLEDEAMVKKPELKRIK